MKAAKKATIAIPYATNEITMKLKILYGVPGEGMGHATRSKVIIEQLLKSYDIHIVTSDKAYPYLKKHFGKRVTEIKGFKFGFKKGRVSKSRTVKTTIKNLPKFLKTNIKEFRKVKKHFAPDFVISDFESFSYYFAKNYFLPIISLDNIQIINRAKLNIDIPSHLKSDYSLAKKVIKAKVPKCQQYLISTFFDAEIKKKNTLLVPPIIRQEILNTKTPNRNGDHILVYQSYVSENDILKLLSAMPNEKFYLYGFNKEGSYKNITLKSFSESEFIQYFASAKGVIANGGYSFISEALHFQKPICAMPIPGQFEQFVNAAYIEKLGYGKCLESLSTDGVKAFLYDLKTYQSNLNDYKPQGNAALFKTLDQTIAKLDLV